MMNFSGNEYWDAARTKRKGLWRTPTREEFSELINKCQWDWTVLNGITGYNITGPNGNSIFLPFLRVNFAYWSSSSTDSKVGTFVGCLLSNGPFIDSAERYLGLLIRPVID